LELKISVKMKYYKGFIKLNIPESFDYDITKLKTEGYRIRGRFNKNNPKFQELCNDLKGDKNQLKIIDINRKNMVDIWIKSKTE